MTRSSFLHLKLLCVCFGEQGIWARPLTYLHVACIRELEEPLMMLFLNGACLTDQALSLRNLTLEHVMEACGKRSIRAYLLGVGGRAMDGADAVQRAARLPAPRASARTLKRPAAKVARKPAKRAGGPVKRPAAKSMDVHTDEA